MSDDAKPAVPAGKPCPVCGKPRDKEFDPFCSRRCADVDLYKWLNGSYVIPGVAKPGEDSGDVED